MLEIEITDEEVASSGHIDHVEREVDRLKALGFEIVRVSRDAIHDITYVYANPPKGGKGDN